MMKVSKPGACAIKQSQKLFWTVQNGCVKSSSVPAERRGIMKKIKDVTEVIVYVAVMGFVGCVVGMGLMNCII
ncbi:MAG: hypothetical protein K2L82_07930 [Lachnospiraceae bacterium]|nr:hypothetical protein [Lachnospiraceae bacterium]